MGKKLKDILEENPNLKISDADMALGRDHPDALEQIIKNRGAWGNATAEERASLHNQTENIRKAYGGYSGGANGNGGKYSPQYQKPDKAASAQNVDDLYNKFNSFNSTHKAPTWTPRYEAEIQNVMNQITGRGPFEYDMNNDPMYQQYREQYIREGRKGMEDTIAATAGMTGGYGSTYGATAAQQGYDNYLAGLNDRVPELQQAAFGRYLAEGDELHKQLGALQTEENRLYGQHLDKLGQYNIDRDFDFGAWNAAMNQNNYENNFDRGVFESDRDYGFAQDQFNEQKAQFEKQFAEQQKQAAIQNALAIGDYSALEKMGFNTEFLKFLQQVDRSKGRAAMMQAALTGSGGSSGGGGRSGGGRRSSGRSGGRSSGRSSGGGSTYTAPKAAPKKSTGSNQAKKALYVMHAQQGDSPLFAQMAASAARKGQLSKKDYNDMYNNWHWGILQPVADKLGLSKKKIRR